MKQSVIKPVLCLASAPDVDGWRRLICRIDKVEKATFPRSGLMDKKGIYASWNANVSPYCVWLLPGFSRYVWYRTMDDAIAALRERFYNEIYHGAEFVDPDVFAREQAIAEQRYSENI